MKRSLIWALLLGFGLTSCSVFRGGEDCGCNSFGKRPPMPATQQQAHASR